MLELYTLLLLRVGFYGVRDLWVADGVRDLLVADGVSDLWVADGVRDLRVADFRVDVGCCRLRAVRPRRVRRVGVSSGNPSYSAFKKSSYFRMAAMSDVACLDHGSRVNGFLWGGSP